jgi:uncharacterized membrane protein
MAARRSTNPRSFLSPVESDLVTEAIGQAERRTSAEIKLVIVRHCWTDIRRKAAKVFRKLGLDKTEQRNCALIMLVTTNREFLIYGDEGIHQKVGQDFWDDVRDAMKAKFREGLIGEGLQQGIRLIGEKLAHFFPYRPGDKDEISDKVAYEES